MNKISEVMVNGVKYSFNDTEKANKSTTLSGYGITDAYTKDEIDNMIGNMETIISTING